MPNNKLLAAMMICCCFILLTGCHHKKHRKGLHVHSPSSIATDPIVDPTDPTVFGGDDDDWKKDTCLPIYLEEKDSEYFDGKTYLIETDEDEAAPPEDDTEDEDWMDTNEEDGVWI